MVLLVGNIASFDASIDKDAEGGPVCDFNRAFTSEEGSGPIYMTRFAMISIYGPLFFDILYNGVANGRTVLKKALDKVKTESDVDFYLEGNDRR